MSQDIISIVIITAAEGVTIEAGHGNIDYDQLNNQDLFWKYKDLQLILQLYILSELGFSINEIKDIYHIHN